jgi:hypothetical protein
MVELPPEIQARRNAEDTAIQLGQERAELEASLASNTLRIKELISPALAFGITLEALSQMVRVSRQTLHHWRNETGFEGSPVSLEEPR